MTTLPSDEMCAWYNEIFNKMDSADKCKKYESYDNVVRIITASDSGKNLDKIVEEQYIVLFCFVVDRNGFGPDGYNFTHHDRHGIDRWGKKTGTPFKDNLDVFSQKEWGHFYKQQKADEYEYQFRGNTVTG